MRSSQAAAAAERALTPASPDARRTTHKDAWGFRVGADTWLAGCGQNRLYDTMAALRAVVPRAPKLQCTPEIDQQLRQLMTQHGMCEDPC